MKWNLPAAMKDPRWLFSLGETHAISRALFLRGLGLIYLIAMLSWWVQVDELVGSRGLVPMGETLERLGPMLEGERWTRLPTLFWFGHSDAVIHLVCLAGVVLAALLVAGFIPGPALLGLWAIYLSLVNSGNVFMSFQWDILLVEAGFLAVWLAPWRCWRLPLLPGAPPPLSLGEKAALWLCWFLIAKLMFQSGWVKLAWATPAQPEWWPDHTAMTFHYFTQPIPNPLAWWMHQLPAWFHRASLWPMYFIELALPVLVFLGNRARLIAALGFAGLMLGILLTGNYTYFNWLTIVLCLPLVADRYWRRLFRHPTGSGPRLDPVGSWQKEWPSLAWRGPALILIAFLNGVVCLGDWHEVSDRVKDPALPWTHLSPDLTPDWADRARADLSPFFFASGYGLFRTMTTERPEIVFEGSADGVEWREYDVRWKPGALDQRPPLVAPHQPRVAWQLWFAALESGYHPRSRNAPWISGLVRGLLDNDPVALSFFEENPFPDHPPAYVRGVRYRYEFTHPAERSETGHWWRRERQGLWLPSVGKGPPR